jgi:AMP-binding enzyme
VAALPAPEREMSDATIETLLAEEGRFPPPAEFAARGARGPRAGDVVRAVHLALRVGAAHAKWYLGGKLNATYNCVDRHVEAGNGGKVAYYWEGEPEGERRELTFADLLRETTKLANALKALGVRKGTPVGIYMGMVPETPIAMLACARLGAPHTVVFGGFSADSLSGRLQDMECEVLITQDEAAGRHDDARGSGGRRGDQDARGVRVVGGMSPTRQHGAGARGAGVWHAQRCLDHCGAGGARGLGSPVRVRGARPGARARRRPGRSGRRAKARAAGDAIAGWEDREHFDEDYAAL